MANMTNDTERLITRVERLENTLAYIAAVAGTYSTDDSMGKRFAAIRDTALEMVNNEE